MKLSQVGTAVRGIVLGLFVGLIGAALLAQGPRTNALNLRLRTDASSYLVATTAAYTAPDSPLTNFANLKLRTDANGYLLTTMNGAQTFSGNLVFSPDATYSIGLTGATRPTSLFLSAPSITAGSGTGITVNDSGEVREQVYKVTVLSTNFIAAAVTADVTIATLPAKTFLVHALADLTTTFACASVCTTATLSATLGKTAGGNQYLLSFDADAATSQFGDAAAELGASLAPATTPTEAGDLGSWTTTTAVQMRLTSGTGNIGTGAATNLSQGAVTFYLTTKSYP